MQLKTIQHDVWSKSGDTLGNFVATTAQQKISVAHNHI